MEKVTVNSSETLRRAVEAIVRIKRSMNDQKRKSEGFCAWRDSLPDEFFIDQRGGDYACWPSTTLKAILPFFVDGADPASRARPARVPVASLLGSSYKWSEHLRPRTSMSVDENIQFFLDDARAFTTPHRADVRLIRQLGIFYVSCEGKNRVAFLAHHSRDWMPCRLDEQDYPEADRLQVIEVREGPQRSWLCVKDDQHAEFIAYPELTLPLLQAYGVRTGQWSSSWPMQSTVMNSLRLQQVEDEHLHGLRSVPGRSLDLHYLGQREEEVQRPHRQPAFSAFLHPQLEIPRGCLLALGGVLFTIAALGHYLPLQEQAALRLWWGSAFALLGFIAGLLAPARIRAEKHSSMVVATLAADSCSGTPPTLRRSMHS